MELFESLESCYFEFFDLNSSQLDQIYVHMSTYEC